MVAEVQRDPGFVPATSLCVPLFLRLKENLVRLIQACELNTRVVRFENSFRRPALPGEAVCADLAHADAVAPAAADEIEAGNSAALVVLAIDDEELFAQAERGADASATNVSGAVRAYDFEVGNTM